MFVLRFIPLALTALWSVTCATSSHHKRRCTKPAVRKEWRTFSRHERAEWIRAVNCLSHLPHDPALAPSVNRSESLATPVNSSSSYYDDFVYIHMDLNTRIHWTGQFLPWHRWYVQVFEESLKCKCGYTGVSPYWNWTIDSPDFFKSSFWQDSDPVSGLGGWGDPNADFSVPDGGFSQLHLSYPSPHTLRRNFTLRPWTFPLVPNLDFQKEANVSFSASAIETLLETPAGDFKGFQAAFEVFQGAHAAVHLITGGDLAPTCPKNAPPDCWKIAVGGWAPNEPLFFMHHAMIDKVWFDWQHRNPENAKSFFGGSVQAIQSLDSYNKYPNGGPPFLNLDTIIPSDGLFPEVTIRDVLNTTGGVLCYVYE